MGDEIIEGQIFREYTATLLYLCFKYPRSTVLYLCFKYPRGTVLYLCFKYPRGTVLYLCFKYPRGTVLYLCFKYPRGTVDIRQSNRGMLTNKHTYKDRHPDSSPPPHVQTENEKRAIVILSKLELCIKEHIPDKYCCMDCFKYPRGKVDITLIVQT